MIDGIYHPLNTGTGASEEKVKEKGALIALFVAVSLGSRSVAAHRLRDAR
jgi:hypothetical protein